MEPGNDFSVGLSGEYDQLLQWSSRDTYYSTAVAVTQVSYTFSRDFISLLLKDGNVATDFGRTEVLLKGLRRVSRNTCVLLI